MRPAKLAGPAPAGLVPVATGCRLGAGGRGGRVVIVSASVGAGHDGAAQQWARRLREHGFEVDLRDLLGVLPGLLGRGMRDAYAVMLRVVPRLYSVLFWAAELPGLGAGLVRVLLAPFGSRMCRLLPADTVAVLSTHPLASQLLGRLRRRGRIAVPVFTFLTDFSVHRLWVAAGVDAHFALHELPAEQALHRGAGKVLVTGALVSERFAPALVGEQRAARRQLGLPADQRLALLVAGSWGVGEVARAAAEIAASGVAVPVVVCGRNEALRSWLRQRNLGCPLGWVDDMPGLMRAVDVLVENAGGLTSLEAMASGLPVATYRPIPGHGRANAAALQRAGVAVWIHDATALGATLAELLAGPRGRRQRSAALDLFAADPVGEGFEAAVHATPPVAVGPQRASRWRRRAMVAAVMAACVVNGTVGTQWAVAHGLDAARPDRYPQAVFVVVHPSPATQVDRPSVGLLVAAHAAVAVDPSLIQVRPELVQTLTAAGLTPVNAGPGPRYETGIVGGRSVIVRNAAAIRRVTGDAAAFYLSGPGVDAVDVGTVWYLRERIVRAGVRIGEGTPLPPLHGGEIVLIQCAAQPRPDCDLAATLTQLGRQATARSIRLAPLTDLRR